jgi:hypothetical protein
VSISPATPWLQLLTVFEDLTGVGIAETIKGIQDAGIIACAKHFIGNEQVNNLHFYTS